MVLNRRRVASVNRRPRVPQGRSSIVSPPGIHLNDIVPEGITSVYLPPDEAVSSSILLELVKFALLFS